jgi:hypothetical protein
MGLRQTISQWIANVKDALDFGPEFPAVVTDHRVKFTEELTKLQDLLDQTQRAAQEKDELIARLQAAGAVRGNMIIDGFAYFVKSNHSLDGPFCLSCFQQNHQIAHIVPAPKPEEADGAPSEWVQCGRCQVPFRSQRIGQYLNPRETAATGDTVLPEATAEAKPVKATRKPRSQTRQRVSRASSPRCEGETRSPTQNPALGGETPSTQETPRRRRAAR